MTGFIFKAILKELVSSAISNGKPAFHLEATLTRGINQPPTIGADQALTHVMTAMINDPATQVGARSAHATTTTPSPSTLQLLAAIEDLLE